MEILRNTYKGGQQVIDINEIIWLDVEMMYGIEYEEFPARIAEVAMWLVDHQMNMLISNEFGQYFARLPLKKAANIVHGNALQLDWNSLIKNQQFKIESNETTITLNEPQTEYTIVNIRTKHLTIIDERIPSIEKIQINRTFDYILGNPPFVGKSLQSNEQKADMQKIFAAVNGAGVLDYVTAWYVKASQLIQNTQTKVAFVSTNSISQGEQVGILWNLLFNQYHIKIHFAHRTFSWRNEAKGNAAVHVVIIGFASYDISDKRIFEYEEIKGEPHGIKVKNINPYLLEGRDDFVVKRRNPICSVSEMIKGSMPNDGGHFLFSKAEKDEFVKAIGELMPKEKMSNPIKCQLQFYCKRPKTHYKSGKSSNILKDTAPKYNINNKDLDNMVKFVLDALNDKLYTDDSLIFEINCSKLYSDGEGHIYIKFMEIDDAVSVSV